MVGGPDLNDGYKDEISNFTMNEVACDYNACFVASLSKMYDLYGGNPLSDSLFSPEEIPEPEFFVAAHINSAGNDYTEIKVNLTNQSSWPARLIKDLSFNYYIDLSEFFAAGFSIDDLEINMHGSEIPMTLSVFTHYNGDIYYIKISTVDGNNVAPIDQTSFEREVTFRIAAPNASGAWDPANDFSYEGLQTQKAVTEKIPVYEGNTLISGFEPDQDPLATTTPDPTG